jgi:hypothetical protein
MEGVPPSEVKDELTANAARREELKAKLAAADARLPLLHPEMAELYRLKVATLAQALEQQETRAEATEAHRGPHRRHHPHANSGRAQNRTEREPAGHAGGGPKCEEVRKPATSRCKLKWLRGPQPKVLAAAYERGVNPVVSTTDNANRKPERPRYGAREAHEPQVGPCSRPFLRWLPESPHASLRAALQCLPSARRSAPVFSSPSMTRRIKTIPGEKRAQYQRNFVRAV